MYCVFQMNKTFLYDIIVMIVVFHSLFPEGANYERISNFVMCLCSDEDCSMQVQCCENPCLKCRFLCVL